MPQSGVTHGRRASVLGGIVAGGDCRPPEDPGRHGQIQTTRRLAGAAPSYRTGGRRHPMSEPELDDELDAEMDQRLARFARSTRQPALADEGAGLPWTVQLGERHRSPFGFLSGVGGGRAGFRRTAFGLARLGATLAVAGSLLLLVGRVHTGGTAADLVQPLPSARPSIPLAAPGAPEVVLVPTSGVVDDVMADHVAGAVRRAESDGAAAVIVQLDTLGGSEDAMLRIDAALHSKIPTIVWVGPSGAKAASAGTFITLSANLAYMAPSTNI